MSPAGPRLGSPGGGAAPAIEARGLARRYGPVGAVEPLDLSIAAGESVVLFGPNGAGKSTLLRLLATLIRPTSGSLRLFGEETLSGGAPALRRRIGFLSHQTFLYDHLTARENLLFYGRLYGLPDPEGAALEAIRTVRLGHRQDDCVGTYSRGMQQRLAIARALLHRPDIVLLDEPFTGLDRESTHRLEDRLRQEREAGRTCVMATHDLGHGLRAADRVILLRNGVVALDRPARALDPREIEGLLIEGPPEDVTAATPGRGRS
ncbi:MAG: heme ABC exporter ATP-binding protein CcmA [Acidobacteriota bacterium]